MHQNASDRAPELHQLVLSGLTPGRTQKRLALAIVAGISVIFGMITVGALSGLRISRFESFMPAYLTALFILDSITAVLLFAQYSILRTRATLIIASGYLFAALVVIPYGLSFPGVLAPLPEFGGPQSTACLFILWHAGFPLFVIAYALSNRLDDRSSGGLATHRAIVRSVGLTTLLVLASGLACLAGGDWQPEIMINRTQFSPLFVTFVGIPVMLLGSAAIVLLWLRPRSMLDLWLMVVMFVFVIEIPTSYYPDPARFSPGWFAARLLGVLGSSIILVVLLYEIRALYVELLGAVRGQRRERQARLITGNAVAAAIAHEVKNPLSAIVMSADAGLRFLDRPAPEIDKSMAAFARISKDGHRAAAVIESVRAIFKKVAPNKVQLDVNDLIRQALAVARSDLAAHRIVIQAETAQRLPAVLGDPVQLQQVFLNLLTNAIDAMATADEPRILRVKSELFGLEGVVVSVIDTGTGLGSLDLNRIFDPLVTTKSDGMGMGLSICRSIVEAHEGQLWAVPNVPRGSAFHFTLHAGRPEAAVG